MNPKDVVFMSLLITSAVLGLQMADQDEELFQTTGKSWRNGIRSFFRQFLRGEVWLAGFILGFSSATRLAAPLIGLVIFIHILLSRKWGVLPRFFAYGLIAFGFMIAFWPYLWPDPLGRLIESILNSAHYPDVHLTLFRGTIVNSQHTPLSYLPVLLAVQLTETTLLLILVGTFALLKKSRPDLIALSLTWFVLPAVVIIWIRVNLYDNLRQVFFILPPLFLIAGVGLDWFFTIIRRPGTRYLILFLVLVPGLYANITLYPYQYVYYNQAVGGIRGAYRNYELDYWHLAFKEAQGYVNQTAYANANIFVGDSKSSAQTFARPDLIFNAFGARKRNRDRYDYLVVSTSENADKDFAELVTVFVVERDGVPFVYVKKPK
jgi:hypothetical protein